MANEGLTLPDITTPVAVPKGFAVTPGAVDVDHGQDAPVERTAWSSIVSLGKAVADIGSAVTTPAGMVSALNSPVTRAAFRQDNTVGAYFASEDRDAPTYKEDGFNPWDAIKGTKYEPYWSSFVDVSNTRHADLTKAKIDREIEDRKTLDAAPWYQSLPAQMIAGAVDWPTLLPGGTFVRGATGGISIARSAATVGLASGGSALAQEVALHAMEETRTMKESALAVGAGTFLGGLLGYGGARLLSHAEMGAAVAAMERELAQGADAVPVPVPAAGVPAAVGAAANVPASVEANAIAGRAAGAVAKATERLNPALRLLQSPSAAVRDIATNLFENSVYLKKNFEGVASAPAVETLMKEWNSGLVKAIQFTDDAFAEFRKAGGTLGRDEFRQEVGKAMRRGDEGSDPFITKAAQQWRAQVFDPLKEAAIKAGLLPEGVTVDTAASYFSRMWNRNKLIAREGEFKQIVRNWIQHETPKWMEAFDKETIEKSAKLKGDELVAYQTERRVARDARFDNANELSLDIANEVFNKLTGKTESGVRPEFITVQARGPLKERTFDIPDHLIEDFLEHDVEHVGRRYTRVMGADVEVANKFGSVDMKEQIQKIRDDYARLRQGVTDEKTLTKLGNEEKADIRDIEALRDLLRGTRQVAPWEQSYDRIVRGFNHFNYIRSMGEVVLASVTDAVRPAMVHGLGAFLGNIGHLATNMKAVKLSVGEAQLAGNVAERVLAHRLATLSEIADPYAARGPVESFLANMSNVASKWNGIRLWTDGMKGIASVMTQNRVLGNVEKFGTIKAKEKAYLAYLGIDQSMAERIHAQFVKHGENIEGVRVAKTEAWDDPVAVRTYRAAINKDVDSIIVQKSVADVPLFANTPTGKALLQFKSFALASHQKVLLRGLQEDQARFVGGLVAMTMMGMFITWMKAVSGNRPETQEKALTNPGWWIGEGIDRAGVFSVPMEVANAFEKFAGVNPIKSPLRGLDPVNNISQKNQNRSKVGSLLGPTAGFVDDATTVLGIPGSLYQGEDMTKGQKTAIKSVMPFGSYMGIRQMMNYLVLPPE